MLNPVRQRSSLKTDEIKPEILSLKDLLEAIDEDEASYGTQLLIRTDLFYDSDLERIENFDEEEKKNTNIRKNL